MRKITLILVGVALLAGQTSRVAFSKERHHVRNARQFNAERFRNTNAYAAPLYVPDTGSAELPVQDAAHFGYGAGRCGYHSGYGGLYGDGLYPDNVCLDGGYHLID